MSAAAPGKVAYDGPGENSLLFGELLKEIVLPGQSAEAVFNHTRLGVSRASNGEQVPLVSSSMIANFTFVPGTAKVASISRQPAVIDEPRAVAEPTDAVAASDAVRTNPGETAADTPGSVDERPSAVVTEKKQVSETPPRYKLQSRPSAVEKPARVVKEKEKKRVADEVVHRPRRYSEPEWTIKREQPRSFFGWRRHQGSHWRTASRPGHWSGRPGMGLGMGY
jgi:hypothetical protein